MNRADYKLHDTSYFKKNGAVFKYEIWAGKNKDYYFEFEVEAKGQKFNLYNFVLIGDATEERARANLRLRNIMNPSPNGVADEIGKIFKPVYEQLAETLVDEKKQPETWIPTMKALLKETFSK